MIEGINLYKIENNDGMHVIWQKNIYLPLQYVGRLSRIDFEWQGRYLSRANEYQLNED